MWCRTHPHAHTHTHKHIHTKCVCGMLKWHDCIYLHQLIDVRYVCQVRWKPIRYTVSCHLLHHSRWNLEGGTLISFFQYVHFNSCFFLCAFFSKLVFFLCRTQVALPRKASCYSHAACTNQSPTLMEFLQNFCHSIFPQALLFFFFFFNIRIPVKVKDRFPSLDATWYWLEGQPAWGQCY